MTVTEIPEAWAEEPPAEPARQDSSTFREAGRPVIATPTRPQPNLCRSRGFRQRVGLERSYHSLECCPTSRVIGTCTFQEVDSIQEALNVGAVSCLVKNVCADEMASTIRSASR